MAATETNRWKLGLFVVLGHLAAFAALVALGASKFDKPFVPFVTYFDESVQGLEIGSPVKFRGVRVGTVSRIAVAPDRRKVEVECEVDVSVLERLGLRPDSGPIEADEPFVPDDMRVQLVSSGITGVKFLQADFFDVKKYPAPGLPFPTPPNYIPSVSSTLKSVEESVLEILAEFPDVMVRVRELLARAEKALDEVDLKGISDRAVKALEDGDDVIERADTALQDLDAKMKDVDLKRLTETAQQAAEKLDSTLTRADAILKRSERGDGLLSELERTARELRGIGETVASINSASLAVGDVARDGRDLADDLEETLQSVNEAAESIRGLAKTLERDADMLLKGRSQRDE